MPSTKTSTPKPPGDNQPFRPGRGRRRFPLGAVRQAIAECFLDAVQKLEVLRHVGDRHVIRQRTKLEGQRDFARGMRTLGAELQSGSTQRRVDRIELVVLG